MNLHPDDENLAAAIQLLGREQGHAMLGCDWGHGVVVGAQDNQPCIRQARQRMVLHAGTASKEAKLCHHHADMIMTMSTPRTPEARN